MGAAQNFLEKGGGVSKQMENYFIKLKAKVLVKGLWECEARTVGRNSVQVGIHNRQLVLDVIRTNQPITRREIARLTGLTSAAVTNIVSNFIEQGFVREVGYGRSGGRTQTKAGGA